MSLQRCQCDLMWGPPGIVEPPSAGPPQLVSWSASQHCRLSGARSAKPSGHASIETTMLHQVDAALLHRHERLGVEVPACASEIPSMSKSMPSSRGTAQMSRKTSIRESMSSSPNPRTSASRVGRFGKLCQTTKSSAPLSRKLDECFEAESR